MRRWQVRVLTAGASGLFAIGVVGVAVYRRPTRDIDFHEVNEEVLREVTAELAQRQLEVEQGRLARFPLEEEVVRALMPLGGRQRYDPLCYFTYQPELRITYDWQEHPEGSYPIVTNSLGIRRDGELMQAAPDLRVLVTGDSHIDGVCANSESFTALLEASLRAARPGRTVEVINAARGGYSFYHYLGVLERFLHLAYRPDLFVMVVYGGNDFTGVYLWHLFHGTQRPKVALERSRLTKRLSRDFGPALGQCLDAAEYFRSRWRETGPALEMGYEVTREVRRVCDAEGIELLVVYLPSPTEVPERAHLDRVREAATLLGLGEQHLAVIGRMADAYLDSVRAAGIEVVDLRPGFERSEELLFWKRDLHLNLAGQRKVRELVQPWLEAWEERR